MSRAVLPSTLRAAARPSKPTCLPLPYTTNSIAAASPSFPRYHSTSSQSTQGSSVSASEVSHFTQLASSWWDPHGPSRLLHLMNPLRHDFIRSCLATSAPSPTTSQPEPQEKHTFLDIGCGGGIFASSAARLPTTKSVTAIDPTPEVIAVANQHKRSDPLLSQPNRLTYINCAIEDLSSHLTNPESHSHPHPQPYPPPPKYDFITLFEVLEHIDHPSTFLRTCLTHLKPHGWLIGSTISRHPISYLTTKIVAEAPWPIGVVPAGTHDWNKYINPAELKQFFAKENTAHFERSHGNEDGDDASGIKVVEGAQRLAVGDVYGDIRVEGCVYVPLLGWRFVKGSEEYGNYFFGVQRLQ